MKKPDKKEMMNLFFSAFLIIAFIVCAHFFEQFTGALSGTVANLILIAVYAVFGLLVFYATRVGDGKAVKRFSPVTLIVLVIPTLYIIVGALAPFMPLHSFFTTESGALSIITALAAVAFGYGIPYTFISGFELEKEAEEVEDDEEPEALEGGVEADLLDAEAEDAAEAVEEAAEVEAPVEDAPAEEAADE